MMKGEVYDSQVEVFVRVMSLSYLGDTALDEPAVIVTTFLNGRIDEREIYNQHGEELVS